jgi:oligopeptide/dipeptide ABC transporter ATP-binding protein
VDGVRENLLGIRGLGVTYLPAQGVAVRALDNISLDIHRGEVLGILGESGSGKSTLASAILQVLPRNAKTVSGEILFRDRNLLALPESELRAIRGLEISLVAQDPALSLNPVLSVGTQVAEVLRAHLPLRAKQRRERVHELFSEVGFEQPAAIYGAYPHQLSGGQRQRVVIAQAVACRPKLLIADEPTSKLDTLLRSEIVSLLSRIREAHGTTILLISHDPTLFSTFADRVALMYAGSIVEIGKCSDVLARPFHPYTQALVQVAMSAMDATAGLKSPFAIIDGDPPDSATATIGCRFEPRCSDRMEACTHHFPREIAPEPARFVSCLKYGE